MDDTTKEVGILMLAFILLLVLLVYTIHAVPT